MGFLFEGVLPSAWQVTLFGGEGTNLFGLEGQWGVLYYVVVGLLAVPAIVLADADDWEHLVDLDWAVIILFGGGISLADALGDTNAISFGSGHLELGSGHLEQRDMIRAGITLNVLLTVVLTVLIVALFRFVWPFVLW